MNLRKLGEAVRDRRRSLGWSREHLAALAGVHWRSVGNLERCDCDARWGVAVSIAEAVGLTVVCVDPEPAAPDTRGELLPGPSPDQ